jgi:hypothetical protein|mmetsp:Transcript_64354/g.106519  ORF Transcript_64354/g.106519 Transcript_64354/m.106519 type:complete len:106 (+) Transcript_64354:154-471(+)
MRSSWARKAQATVPRDPNDFGSGAGPLTSGGAAVLQSQDALFPGKAAAALRNMGVNTWHTAERREHTERGLWHNGSYHTDEALWHICAHSATLPSPYPSEQNMIC